MFSVETVGLGFAGVVAEVPVPALVDVAFAACPVGFAAAPFRFAPGKTRCQFTPPVGSTVTRIMSDWGDRFAFWSPGFVGACVPDFGSAADSGFVVAAVFA